MANRTTVLEDLTLVSDHLPVVADYTDTITPAADPIIGSLSLSASSVKAGDLLTATAENVIDAGTGTITGVSFYLESNGVSGLQPGSDAFVGTGTQNGTSWSTAIDTAGLLPGTYTYYAVATDSFGGAARWFLPTRVAGIVLPAWVDSSSAATWDAGSNTLTVTGAPTIIGDPGLANAPSIIASGAGAQVTVAPTDGSQVIHLGALSLSGGATLSIPHVDASRVTLAVGMPGGPASVFGVDSSTLDIADNILIVEASPDDITQQLASVQQAVQAGKGNGSWTGTGITSWTVAADVAAGTNQTFHTTVAIAHNGAFRVPFTSYGGQAVDATSIIITQSLVADGDFNGTVDNADLVTLLIHFGLDNQSQSSGDYDGNGNVDNADLVGYSPISVSNCEPGRSHRPSSKHMAGNRPIVGGGLWRWFWPSALTQRSHPLSPERNQNLTARSPGRTRISYSRGRESLTPLMKPPSYEHVVNPQETPPARHSWPVCWAGVCCVAGITHTGSGVSDTAYYRMYVDTETGKAFRHKVQVGDSWPIYSPISGKNTGMPAEPCFWTPDGTIKKEPDWVVLNEFVGIRGRRSARSAGGCGWA